MDAKDKTVFSLINKVPEFQAHNDPSLQNKMVASAEFLPIIQKPGQSPLEFKTALVNVYNRLKTMKIKLIYQNLGVINYLIL
jgi:hypothetical protein